MSNRVIKVEQLARVEGEGGIFIKLKDGKVHDVRLDIFEPPRFFEAFLRGRRYAEVPDITARICGICPVAYQMSSVHALEDAFGIEVDGPLRALRRLLYCGEWIESHILHVWMLHAPGFLGYDDAMELARDQPALVRNALAMKKTGNDLVALLGGREIHPMNVRVGGFYRVPTVHELGGLLDRLKRGRDWSLEAAKTAAAFDFPEFEFPYEFVALRSGLEYPMNGGRIVSTGGLDIAVREFEFHFEERHVAHSNALQAVEKGVGAYCVGPMARYVLNEDLLTPYARHVAAEIGLTPAIRNPFKGILVRSVETALAFDEAVRIIGEYECPPEPAVAVVPRAGIGFGASEAPRGMLYHRYRVGADGLITDARIVPPTSQNQRTIENDLRVFAEAHADLPREELTLQCEQVVRNYDPCISCATHFVRLDAE